MIKTNTIFQMKTQVILIGVFLFHGILTLEAQNLYIKDKNDIQNMFVINEIKKITFSDDTVKIDKYQNKDLKFAIAEIQYISFFDYTPVSFNNTSLQEKEYLFPNPTANILYIKHMPHESGNVHIDIINIQGKVLKSKNIKTQKGDRYIDINVSDLESSVYLCRIYNNETTKIYKFLKK